MHAPSTAIGHLRALLGANATDDALWDEIGRFQAIALPFIISTWELDRLENRTNHWRIVNPPDDEGKARHKQRIAETVQHLRTKLGATASRGAAAIYLNPQLWQPASQHHSYTNLLKAVATAVLKAQPPADWPQRLARRILTVCRAHSSGGDPSVADCVGWLLESPPKRAGRFLDALGLGDWAEAWSALVALADQRESPSIERLGKNWLACGSRHSVALLRRWFDQDRLDASTFRRFLTTLPGSLNAINGHLSYRAQLPATDRSEIAFVAALERLANQVIWDLINDFRPETWETLGQIHYLCGGFYLIRLVEEIDRLGLTSLNQAGYRLDRAQNVLLRLFGNLKRRPDDDSAALTDLLRRFAVPTLLAALPHADAYRAEICAALDWPQADALVALLERLEQPGPGHSADPTVGVVHRREIADLVESLDGLHLQSLLTTFERHLPAAVTFVRAVMGANRKELRRSFGRRNQLAARALPLLPFEKPGDVLDRYLMLRRYAREANGSAAGRKNYERAAAQAGLSNLALHAGYGDATRLEWAMEDHLGSESVAIGRRWEIEGYALTLVLRDNKPAIDVRKGDRALKRTPALVTREYDYREVRATLDQAKEQMRRYRATFLESMRLEQALSSEEIALLRRNPLAVALLERLVLLDEAGACGLFRAEDTTLEGTHGERVPISGAVRIAHPLVLQEHGWLADWQTEIVKRGLVQPFKQVFRELYLITPAEIAARYESGRLAGRRLNGRQSRAVLANLGWLVDGYELRKPLYELGYAAHFQAGYDYYDDDDDRSVTGTLTFWPLKHEHNGGKERRIPLAAVPPLVFSEIMRDLDLVTVIAHQSEEFGASDEVLRQRGDLVRATVAALGLAQVRVEEPNVHVAGSLTSYRIHLATGAIYLSSGQYLCIVPSVKKRDAVYLPFEEGGEPLSSEIISKVLLLANDAAISDATIIAQIAPSLR